MLDIFKSKPKPPTMESVTPHGVVFGKKGKKFIIKPEEADGNILIVGRPGDGKTSCVAIPTIRAWSGATFCIDIKGELYDKTRTHRKNTKIKVFNPLDNTSCGYNPFHVFGAENTNPVQNARSISQAIIPLPHDVREPYWIECAQSVFTACILHYSAQGNTFLDMIRQMQSMPSKQLIQSLCESPVIEARYFVHSFLNIEDKVISGIMSEISKNVVPFIADKNLVSALSRGNNIKPEDLEYNHDIYINIPEHLLTQWKTLFALIVNQFITYFEQRPETAQQHILFLLDEFPRLGKVPAILDGLATLRSKRVTICLVIQSLAQLDVIYGKNEREVIADICAYKAILGTSNPETQQHFSNLVGTYEKAVTSEGTSTTGFKVSESSTTQEQDKYIIKPHEFSTLKDIVLLLPHSVPFHMPDTKDSTAGFYRVEKHPYYMEK